MEITRLTLALAEVIINDDNNNNDNDIVCLFACFVFNGTFSTYRLYRAIGM